MDPGDPYYAPTVDAVDHAIEAVGVPVQRRVVPTDTIDDAFFDDLADAIVVGPGAPYRAASAAERVITTARERGIPLVGT